MASWIAEAASGPSASASLVFTRPGSGFLPKIPRTQSSGSDQAMSLALGEQDPFQQSRVNHTPEPNLSIDHHNGNLGVVLRHQLGVSVDIHLDDLEAVSSLIVPQQVERLVATAALGPCIDHEGQLLGSRARAEEACEKRCHDANSL